MQKAKRDYGQGSVVKLRYKDRLTGEMVDSRYWYILYRVNGRQVRESTKSEDKAYAENLLQTRKGEHNLGVRPEQDVKTIKYEHVRDAWLADIKNNGQAAPWDGSIAHLNDFFGGMNVVRITTDTIRRYIAQRQKAGAADATIRRNLVNLRAMLNLAKREGKLRLQDVPYFPMPKDSKPRRGYLKPDVFAQLRAALPKNLRPLVSFLYFTGCRFGAAKKITWDMVSADCTEIELPGEITKSGDPVTLPLKGEGLKDVAAGLRKMFRKNGPVFDTTNLRGAWVKTCGALGLGEFDKKKRSYHGLTIHDFRRSAVRNLIRAGVPRGVAMAISGHKTEHVFERYNIVDTADISEALIRVGQYAKISKRA